MDFQKTIRKAIQFKGIGLHAGKSSEVTLKPALADTGIVFIRTDISKKISIPALNHFVVDTTLSTTLGKNGVTIATVEHLMSALWGLGIDNAEIEVNGPEIPILDGSSFEFVRKIQKTGVIELDRLKKMLVITEPVSISDGDRSCSLLRSRSSKISCMIEFNHPLIQKQKFLMKLTPKNFIEYIAEARTFGFLKDVERLRAQGLIAGGSLENAVVLDEKRVLNKEGLRYKDEFVRHKVLDAIGDLALMGVWVTGHWVSHKAGHDLHYKLIQKVLTQKAGYLVGIPEETAYQRLSEFHSLFQPASA